MFKWFLRPRLLNCVGEPRLEVPEPENAQINKGGVSVCDINRVCVCVCVCVCVSERETTATSDQMSEHLQTGQQVTVGQVERWSINT